MQPFPTLPSSGIRPLNAIKWPHRAFESNMHHPKNVLWGRRGYLHRTSYKPSWEQTTICLLESVIKARLWFFNKPTARWPDTFACMYSLQLGQTHFCQNWITAHRFSISKPVPFLRLEACSVFLIQLYRRNISPPAHYWRLLPPQTCQPTAAISERG